MRIQYLNKSFKESTLEIIRAANVIIEEYALEGMILTLRQLYYQFIARDILPESCIDETTGSKNNPKSYGKISKIISDGRLAGLISWRSIEDKTRNLQASGHWRDPGSILRAAASAFRVDKWSNQENRIEVWIEKEALTGVIAGVCTELDVPYFACKGYVSQSEMWEASQRLIGYYSDGQYPIIIHLGDHDPSGIDMTRDILDRQRLFINEAGYAEPAVIRIALNIDQVREYNPPPNPAKITDTRARSYMSTYGRSSWELDALEPRLIIQLIRENILWFRDEDAYQETISEERSHIETLERISQTWEGF